MRKDYTHATQTDMDVTETDFVERYWTRVWQEAGDPRQRLDRVRWQPEYRPLRRALPPPGKGVRILDGGCGTGEWTVHLARLGYEAVGLDLSRETVAALARLFPEAAFAVRDIRETGFDDASFDAYFSWGVFEHFEEGMGRCVAEAYRILKPGGRLLVSVPFDNLRLRWLRRKEAGPVEPAPDARFYQWRLTGDELAGEIGKGGFEIEQVVPIHTRQGVMRSLNHEVGIRYGTVNRLLGAALTPLAPPSVFAHMVLVVARKPLDGSGPGQATPAADHGNAAQ
jgi:SAM-dependent methyltransferase